MKIAAFFAERVLGLVGVLFAVSVLVFVLGNELVPGDQARAFLGSEGATREQLEQVREELGLNDPIVERYWDWLSGVVTGDFGESAITRIQVRDQLTKQIPVSFELASLALIGAVTIGVPLGILAAVRANRPSDLVVRSTLLVVFSIPSFLFGIFLLRAGATHWKALYSSEYIALTEDLGANLRGMTLPALSIALPVSAMVMQMTRGAMLETLNSPYITAARARGVSGRRILFVHALKNALAPVATLVGFVFGTLLGGLVVVEEIFGLPGLGRGFLQAIARREWSAVMAITLVIASTFVLSNTLVDLLYPVLDPRQRKS